MTNSAPNTITDLTQARSGRWIVHTRDSQHIFDLDRGTVKRVPGPGAIPGSNDVEHRMRTVEACRVGERGFWTMHYHGSEQDIDYRWHSSSEIRAIVRDEGESDEEAKDLGVEGSDTAAAVEWDQSAKAGDGIGRPADDGS